MIFSRAHIRLWDAESLETLCVLGLGEYELRAEAVAFSSSCEGDILLTGKNTANIYILISTNIKKLSRLQLNVYDFTSYSCFEYRF